MRELLARHQLGPADGDKDDRGTLVLVAGARACPGAAILAATAALRLGAGRVQIVTDPAIVIAIGIAVPESLVLGWDGGPIPDDVQTVLRDADAVAVGPGLGTDAAARARTVSAAMGDGRLLLDAGAIAAAPAIGAAHGHVVMAPNATEAQELLGDDTDDVASLAARLYERMEHPVGVRGTTSVVATAEGTWQEATAPGLGTPGSGDVLAGLLGALVARGLPVDAALGWAIAVHARAGNLLAEGRDNPGYLARQLIDAVPEALNALTALVPDGSTAR
jgi:hydroxyethylthiazole kinase-like uncharacterized protein yjeF